MVDEAVATRRRWLAAGLVALVAVVSGAAVSWWGGAVVAAGWGGTLVDTGWTPWLLPGSRLLLDASAVVTVGFLLAAAFLAPGRHEADGSEAVGGSPLLLSPTGRGWVRGASWAAAIWAFAAAASLCLTMSDVLGVPASQAVGLRGLADVGFAVDAGRVLIAVLVLAVVVAVASWYVRTVTATAAVTLLALLAVLPPAFAGHSAAAGNHQLAVSALLIHVVGSVLWTGGLLALLLGRRRPSSELTVSVRRFSQLALCCYVLVGATGVVIALVRLWSLSGIFTTFGLLVGLKVVALVTLGAFGWWHRRRSIPRLAAGARGAFGRVAWIEALIMAATFGLAVGLSRTPAPDGEEITGYKSSPLAPLLDALPEPLFCTLALAAAGTYLAGVRRLRDRGGPWPAGRTAAWLLGWALVIFATDVQLAETTSFILVETVQHVVILAAAPLLVAGRPLALGRLVLRPTTDPGLRGPLEWLDELLGARITRTLAHPVAAVALYAASLYGVYASAAHALSINSHSAHLAIFAVALGAGGFSLRLTRGPLTPGPLTDGATGGTGSTRLVMAVLAGFAALVVVVALIAPARPPDLLVTAVLLMPVVAMAAWCALRPEPAPPEPGSVESGATEPGSVEPAPSRV
jgi:putative copper export protein/cytochrome c oxidase assembly factor CtaG